MINVLAGCVSVAAVCALALSVGGPALASSSSEEGASEAEFEQQVAVDPNNGAQRSAVPIEGEGLKLNTQPDDQIRIEGGTVTWLDSAGGVVATIGVSSDQGEDVPFTYDEAAHLLRPDAAPELGAEAFADGCMPKWWGWFFNIAWGTLVCLPATAGVGGVATPIAGAITGAACEAAGGALVTAVSC